MFTVVQLSCNLGRVHGPRLRTVLRGLRSVDCALLTVFGGLCFVDRALRPAGVPDPRSKRSSGLRPPRSPQLLAVLVRHLGQHEPKVRMHLDATAARGIFQRQGLSKVGHIDTDVL